MAECDVPFIDCTNKNITLEELLKLMAVKLPNGDAALRTCGCGCGGDSALPIGNFVFVNTLGDDVTGIREDFHLPFSTLNAAKNAAISGDTIYVYGGTYSEFNTLHKNGVKWHFIGKPILNLFANAVWDDLNTTQEINISGDAVINHLGIGSVIQVKNPNTRVFADFEMVTGNGQHVLLLDAGSGIINIKTKLEVTLVNRCIGLGGNASYVINIDDIFCNAIIGNVANAINCRNQNPTFSGKTIVNSRIIRSKRATGTTIDMEYGPLLGTLIVNVSEKIHRQQAISPANTDAAIRTLGGNLIINGDIDGGTGHAINMQTNAYNKTVEHNGNAYNDGTTPLIGNGDDLGFWSVGKSLIRLNGKYTSSNEKVIKNGTGTPATPQKMIVNGEIISNYNGLVDNFGLYLQDNAGPTLLDSVKIVMDLIATNPRGIGAGGSRDIKITHNVSSNADVDGNITNLITGTNYVFDTDIE